MSMVMVNTLSYFDSNKNTCINSKSPLNITLNVVLREVIISMLKKKTKLFFCFKFSERCFLVNGSNDFFKCL